MNFLSIVFNQAIFIAAVVLLFEGAFLLARRNSSGFRFLSLGVLIAACVIGLTYFEYRSAEHLGNQFVPQVGDSRKSSEGERDGSWANALPVGQREEKTRAYALAAYINEGKIVKYFSNSEGWRAYCPTTEDAQKREQIIRSEAQLAFAEEVQRGRASNELNKMLTYLTAVFLAAFFGWGMGRKRRDSDRETF